MTDASGASVSRRVTILNGRGLHARAAAKFVKLAGTFDAELLQLIECHLAVYRGEQAEGSCPQGAG